MQKIENGNERGKSWKIDKKRKNGKDKTNKNKQKTPQKRKINKNMKNEKKQEHSNKNS